MPFPYMIDDAGNHVRVQGYAAIYGSTSNPGEDGVREVLMRGCFDPVLGSGPKWVRCVAHHDDALGLGDAMIWTDDIGLAFRSTSVLCSRQNHALLSAIVRGDRGVSWRGTIAQSVTETINGELMRVVTHVADLEHVSPTGVPCYSAPRCWLSGENSDDLPSHVRELSMRWQAGQTALRLQAMQRRPASATAAPASRGAPSANTPKARVMTAVQPRARAASKPLTDEEIYGVPRGFTLNEWLDFGHRCACAARAFERTS